MGDNEGSEELFHTNQLLVATSFDEARVATVGATLRHYAAWKTLAGVAGARTEAELAAELGHPSLSEQERLVAGLLAPANLLDVLRHFSLFMSTPRPTTAVVRPPRGQENSGAAFLERPPRSLSLAAPRGGGQRLRAAGRH